MRKPAPAVHSAGPDPASLFAKLAERRGLVLAVSGGPDSTALMVLMGGWPERPPTLVVTVDHGLRNEAREEARLVAENAERLGLPARIMRVDEARSGNLQDWARRARYAKLGTAAREAGYDTIVTAHHLDDQAETFLLRLARGSGVYGLAAMREEEKLDDILLARPLLAISRASLQAIAGESGLQTVADPSNVDLRFDRVRVRKLMPVLAEHGLSANRLAETAGRFGRAAKALDHYAGEFLKERLRVDDLGVVSGPAEAFAEVPEEVALRSLARVVRAVGGADYTPRLDQLEPLLAALRAGGVKRTLSGVVVEAVNGRFSASREWGRDGPRDLVPEAGTTVVWDGRFRVDVPMLSGELRVGGLGRSGGRFTCETVNKGAVRAAPGLYRDGELIALPTGIEVSEDRRPLEALKVKCLVGQRLGVSGADGEEAP